MEKSFSALVGGSFRPIFGVSSFGPGSYHPKSIEIIWWDRHECGAELKITYYIIIFWVSKNLGLVKVLFSFSVCREPNRRDFSYCMVPRQVRLKPLLKRLQKKQLKMTSMLTYTALV